MVLARREERQRRRATPDERHVCPLQLGLIGRVIRLWYNPGELVLSPSAGIGSELYVARQWDRRGYGIELKESHYHTAVADLRRLDQNLTQGLRLLDIDVPRGRVPAPHRRTTPGSGAASNTAADSTAGAAS